MSCRDYYIDLMSAVPQTAADLLQRPRSAALGQIRTPALQKTIKKKPSHITHTGGAETKHILRRALFAMSARSAAACSGKPSAAGRISQWPNRL
jgi:hypothetical protein